MGSEGPGRPPLARRLGRAASGRTLALAFAAVAVAFLASTAVAEYDQLEIRRASTLITGNSAPSIQFLAAMRGELLRYTLLVDDKIDRGLQGLPEDHAVQIAAARRG